uniref:ATP-dependent DNA ligase family profile domain-containing protein n=1 Tax=Percolomonas cosmopolitus TaxID=63605 RepID=A0A7S1KTP4_9EUKA
MLCAYFPEYEWLSLTPLPLTWFSQQELSHCAPQIISQLERALKISGHPEDWYRISQRDLERFGAQQFLTSSSKQEVLLHVLREKYPHTDWSAAKLRQKNKQSAQRWLLRCVESIFAESELPKSWLVRESTEIHCTSHDAAQVDVSISSSSDPGHPIIALDYHGEHHFHDMYHQNPLEIQIEKSRHKRELLESRGIIYVEIPYWWDRSEISLIATLLDLPELNSSADTLQEHAHSLIACFKKRLTTLSQETGVQLINIPSMQEHFEQISKEHSPLPKQSKRKRPLPPLMHPMVWRGENVSNWFMSPKYDGIRAAFFHTRKEFLSKQGVPIPLPQSLLNQLLQIPLNLDGELISTAGGYSVATSIFQRSTVNEQQWTDVRYMVFDFIPSSQEESRMTFAQRQEKLQQILGENTESVIQPVPHERIKNVDALKKRIQSLSQVDEGFVIVEPSSLYTPGRSMHCLKVKSYYDQEVLFLGRSKSGRTFVTELADGHRLKARVSGDVFSDTSMRPGETVLTIAYSHLSQGTGHPLKPMVMRKRLDMKWEDVLENRRKLGSDQRGETTTDSSSDAISRSVQSVFREMGISLGGSVMNNLTEKQQLALVQRVLSRMSHPYMSVSEYQALTRELGFSHEKLMILVKRARRRLRNPWKRMSSDERNTVEECLKSVAQRGEQLKSSDLYSRLEERTSLSREQIRHVVRSIISRQRFGALNSEDRERVRRIVKRELQVQEGRDDEMRKSLYHTVTKEAGLPFYQVRELVRYYLSRTQKVSDNQLSIVKESVLRANGTSPTTRTYDSLTEQTGLPRDKVRKLISGERRKLERQEVTEHHRATVQQIIKDAQQDGTPRDEVYSRIVSKLQVSRDLARELAYNESSKDRKPISIQHKAIVEKHVCDLFGGNVVEKESHANEVGEKKLAGKLAELYANLQLETGLNRSQIVDLVRTQRLKIERERLLTKNVRHMIEMEIAQRVKVDTIMSNEILSGLYEEIQGMTGFSRDLTRWVVRSVVGKLKRNAAVKS